MTKVLNLRQQKTKTAKKEASSPPPRRMMQPQSQLPQRPLQIAWEAPSFYFNPQKRYLALIIIALIFGGGGVMFINGDKMTAVFLILSSLVLVLYSTKRPEISKIILDQRGITIGESFYGYSDLQTFWIHYDPNHIKELSLESKKWYLPYVKVSIENKNPLIIRSLLINFLPEKEHEHSMVEIISRRIGL